MGLFCTDSSAPYPTISLFLSASLESSGFQSPAVRYWTYCKRLTPCALEPLTHTNTRKDGRETTAARVKVLNYCRAVWGGCAERTERGNREERRNKLLYPALIFHWDMRETGEGFSRSIVKFVFVTELLGLEYKRTTLMFRALLLNGSGKKKCFFIETWRTDYKMMQFLKTVWRALAEHIHSPKLMPGLLLIPTFL